jgi:hypothetical protein
MGKGTLIPRQIVNTQPNKPAVQQPVFDVLDQLPFGTDGKQHLEQRMIQYSKVFAKFYRSKWVFQQPASLVLYGKQT